MKSYHGVAVSLLIIPSTALCVEALRHIAVWASEVAKTITKRVYAWLYLFMGPSLIQDGFDRAKDQPYEILSPDTRYVFVPSKKHIRELDSAPDTVLSLQAASKQEIHSEHPIVNGKHPTLWTVQYSMANVAKNEPFMVAALAYIEETLLCAEAVKLLPKSVAPTIGSIIARFLKAHEKIYAVLIPVAEERCQERDLANLGQNVPKHTDCIQWIMETAPRQKPWTPKRIVHELMAIWFGSVHALSTTITFAVQDLCLHPEYVEPLRRELVARYAQFERTGLGLPLLDSFTKESARLTPVESMSMRRYATQPFALSDGTKLSVGDWACVPVKAIMQDSRSYPDPLTFNGFRFASPNDLKSAETDSQFNFSQPKPSIPGRYYAVAVMKVILGQIILNYDCELVDQQRTRWHTWRSSMLPKKNTMVVFTPRDSSA
ncbi:cytochrome P450 [Durotheca rogersii]|uniref:cytochrome P450 n=1 Tax=Durotheca rogersii TaxID=419775 RepID=UPI00221FF963|nr:cytochrome P450 [Durotheca rogersii]KAI5865350.1 cytochrome P450 [Durotheca rogersii]